MNTNKTAYRLGVGVAIARHPQRVFAALFAGSARLFRRAAYRRPEWNAA